MNIPLALQIRRMMLLEPTHVWMQHWVSPEDSYYRGEPECKSLCGTAGCLAGHAIALSSRKSLEEARATISEKYHSDIIKLAAELLGIAQWHGHELFIPWGKDQFDPIIRAAEKHVAGTKEYAQGVAQLLDKAVELWGTEVEQDEYFINIEE